MSQVITEGTNLAMVVEASLGAATPPTSGWSNLQPNSYGNFGPNYKKLPRDPISKNRQKQKGMLVDSDSVLPFEADLTKDLLDFFLEGIFMSATKHSGGTGTSKFYPTAVSATAYTVPSGGALQTNTLVFGRGFTNAANNGLDVVGAGSTGTSIPVAGGVIETPPVNATVEVAGFRAGTAADIQMDVNGNLTATTTNFTTMGLNVGQWIWVGGDTAAGGTHSFATLAYRGFARIKIIAATLLTLERRSWTVGAADTAAGKTIDLYFTRWIRNVAIDNGDYKQPSYAAEVTYPTLSAGSPEYETMLGNMIDQWVFNISLTTKTTISLSMIGTQSNDPTVSRFTGPATALNAVTNLGVSTSTDLMRLRISNTDETGISTDFQSIKITVKNNVAAEKQLGVLGATKLNVGKFEIMIEADVIFTSDDVIKAVHDNRTLSMDVGIRNSDFGVLLDVSSMTLDAGDRKLETNKSVIISSKATGFQDATLGYTMSASEFAFLPAS